MTKILLVEDDKQLATQTQEWLKHEHYTVDVAHDGADGLQLFEHNDYDLTILDWQLPSMSGIDLCKRIRATRPDALVMFLTGKVEIDDKELGFDTGADDYLTKPFHLKELSARVRALLRRIDTTQAPVLKAHDLELESESFKATKAGKPLNLLPKEFVLLEFFMKHPNQVYNARALLKALWPADSEAGEDTVRTHIKNLRRKITAESEECCIVNVFGVGYKLEV
ncbi:MAG: response regulator transcription factor [Cyanobacteria bacterium SZAS LIN-3]|nr:response regulator transcription factor [Cyanobacteria bacterium SZAS LIN-3]MBS2005436.1 response regulator transcription factor [Cyanobacteria bacterium SZAS TMP-1]